jgi:hypothetical protein
MSNRLSRVLCLLCAVLIPAGTWSQEPAETGDAASRAVARLRVWVFAGDSPPQGASIVALGADGSSLSLGDASGQKTEAAYRDLPPGNYTVEVRENQNPVAQQMADLGKDSYHTAIAWRSNGKWSLGIYSDKQIKSASGERPLRLLNFAKGATTTIAIKGLQTLEAEPDSVKEVKLPAKIFTLDISAKAPDADVPARTLSDIDLSVAPAAYVLVSPDYRGRLRPQVIEGGEIAREQVATAGEDEQR